MHMDVESCRKTLERLDPETSIASPPTSSGTLPTKTIDCPRSATFSKCLNATVIPKKETGKWEVHILLNLIKSQRYDFVCVKPPWLEDFCCTKSNHQHATPRRLEIKVILCGSFGNGLHEALLGRLADNRRNGRPPGKGQTKWYQNDTSHRKHVGIGISFLLLFSLMYIIQYLYIIHRYHVWHHKHSHHNLKGNSLWHVKRKLL